MALQQTQISVCNDGNVSQLDVTDNQPEGKYVRIEVYRSSQPSGGYGVTLSGSRVEDRCGDDHLTQGSHRVFRYTFSVGTNRTHRSDLPTLLEGREEFNPPGMPDGSWDVRIRDVDAESPTYGSILHATAKPTDESKGYEISYSLRRAESSIKPIPIRSPLARKLVELNPGLLDISNDLDLLAKPVSIQKNILSFAVAAPSTVALNRTCRAADVDSGLEEVLRTISHPDFARFRKNLDEYEAFGDFGAKPTHPGTNLIGPNAELAAESIFVRQYRAALVLLGRVTSPDMARGAGEPLSLATAISNTRPGVYAIFVGAAINHIGIYKLGLDKVHTDYGGIPMKLAPGSRLENDAKPISDAWRCNQTLGEIADILYLSEPPAKY